MMCRSSGIVSQHGGFSSYISVFFFHGLRDYNEILFLMSCLFLCLPVVVVCVVELLSQVSAAHCNWAPRSCEGR